MSDSSEEKTLPASAEKLKKAREKGQIPHGKEMVTASVTVVCFGYLMLRAPAFATYLEDSLSAVPQTYDAPFLEAVRAMEVRLGFDALFALLPLVALIIAAAVASNIVINGGLVISLHPITPDADKLNPVQGFKRMFGLRTTLELLKSLLKIGVAAYLVCQLFEGALQALVEIPSCGLSCGLSVLVELLKRMLLVMAGLFLVLGALDIGLQKWLFMRDQRMTLTENKRERKDSEGDPLIKKQHRKERRLDSNKTGLRNANFAIRSSEIILALRYNEKDARVPVLVARGKDDGYRPLLEELRALGIPVVFDHSAVVSMSPHLKVGSLIEKDMFETVVNCMYIANVL